MRWDRREADWKSGLCPGPGRQAPPSKRTRSSRAGHEVPSGVGPMALSALEDRSTLNWRTHYAPRA